MSEAKARADARKKKILERGTDRMAIATGQKASSGSNSWRKKKAPTSASESDDTTPKESPRVEELDENDVSTTESSKNSDSVLDDIVDNIDITTLLSKDELAAKEEASKRVLSASKDYNPVEREKAKAKRKALEQEIVRQTEEFDRLAEIQRNKKKSSSTVDGTQVKDKDSSSSRSVVQKEASASVKKRRVKLSKSEWVKIIRCALLVILGGCVGYWSSQDTRRIQSLHPSVTNDFFTSSGGHKTTATPHDMLEDFANANANHQRDDEKNMAFEMVTTIFPAIWREESSNLYVLLHYPVVVVAVVMFLAKLLASRLMIVDSLVGSDKSQGGILASVLAVVMGDFSGITAPLSAFLGETCLFMLVIFLTAACCQRGHLQSPEVQEQGHGEEF